MPTPIPPSSTPTLTLDDLRDTSANIERLTRAGQSPTAAEPLAELFSRTAEQFLQKQPDRSLPVYAFFVPGRVEVLGKHTDYAGGRSVTAAAEQGFFFITHPRTDNTVNILNTASGELVSVPFAAETPLQPGHWSHYPRTVIRRLARNFPGCNRGADIAFSSNLPPAAGMSSSSAMMIAFFLALASANRLQEQPAYQHNITTPETLAEYLATVENGKSFGTLTGEKGVGTLGGSEDHIAILCSLPGRLNRYRYSPAQLEQRIPLHDDYTFVIAAGGVVAEKTGAAQEKYNRASRLVTALIHLWREKTGQDAPHLAAIVTSAPDAADRLYAFLKELPDHNPPDGDASAAPVSFADFSPADLRDRLDHFLTESEEIIPAATDALQRGDLETFGRCVDRSQDIAETKLKNQVPETSFLARSARELGAVAASSFGAGFGGSVWALVARDHVETFTTAWQQRYHERFPAYTTTSRFFTTRPGISAIGW